MTISGFTKHLLVPSLLAVSVSCTHTYRWSSEQGRQCFYRCRAQSSQCHAYCYGGSAFDNLLCGLDCDAATKDCFKSCPDLVQVSQQNDQPERQQRADEAEEPARGQYPTPNPVRPRQERAKSGTGAGGHMTLSPSDLAMK
jgi:hypothetical protein